jgi:hypothetical protein
MVPSTRKTESLQVEELGTFFTQSPGNTLVTWMYPIFSASQSQRMGPIGSIILGSMFGRPQVTEKYGQSDADRGVHERWSLLLSTDATHTLTHICIFDICKCI